ncbi:hypothetical protein SUDANB132_01285 [Streptomyces sp. enrichment culture]
MGPPDERLRDRPGPPCDDVRRRAARPGCRHLLRDAGATALGGDRLPAGRGETAVQRRGGSRPGDRRPAPGRLLPVRRAPRAGGQPGRALRDHGGEMGRPRPRSRSAHADVRPGRHRPHAHRLRRRRTLGRRRRPAGRPPLPGLRRHRAGHRRREVRLPHGLRERSGGRAAGQDDDREPGGRAAGEQGLPRPDGARGTRQHAGAGRVHPPAGAARAVLRLLRLPGPRGLRRPGRPSARPRRPGARGGPGARAGAGPAGPSGGPGAAARWAAVGTRHPPSRSGTGALRRAPGTAGRGGRLVGRAGGTAGHRTAPEPAAVPAVAGTASRPRPPEDEEDDFWSDGPADGSWDPGARPPGRERHGGGR